MNRQKKNHHAMARTRLIGIAWGLAGMLALAGCSAGNVSPAGVEDDALTLLSAALDAWQAGQKPDQLRSENPAVHVGDEDWEAGKTLKAYSTPEAPVQRGGHWRVSAVLTLSANGQAEEQKHVAYAVTTEPAITIIRAEGVH